MAVPRELMIRPRIFVVIRPIALLVEYLSAAVLTFKTVTHMSGTWPDVKDEVFGMCSGTIFSRIDYDDI